MWVEIAGGPYDREKIELPDGSLQIVFMDTSKMKFKLHTFHEPKPRRVGDRLVSQPPSVDYPDYEVVPTVTLDIKEARSGKFYAFWPKEK